jgi:hypothetical protein
MNLGHDAVHGEAAHVNGHSRAVGSTGAAQSTAPDTSPDISYNTQSASVDHGHIAQILRDVFFECGQLSDRLSSSISSCIS